MQSKAATVDAYLSEVPADRRAALERLRDLCRTTLKGYTESMTYGMPSYGKNGVVEVGFNSQKHYIALYLLKQDVLDRFRADLKGISLGKGCIRYTKPEKIDFALVKKMLTASRKSKAEIC